MENLYLIMCRFPFPNVPEPLAECHIQEAERKIGGFTHYGQTATRVKKLLLYDQTDAERIIEYQRLFRPHGVYWLYQYPGRVGGE